MDTCAFDCKFAISPFRFLINPLQINKLQALLPLSFITGRNSAHCQSFQNKNRRKRLSICAEGFLDHSLSHALIDLPESMSGMSKLRLADNESVLQHVDSVAAAQFDRELNPKLMPRHVAIIMDGNSRWAEKRGLEPGSGHEAGVEALRKVVELSCRWGIQMLTVFALSTENWFRPKSELDCLMSIIERGLHHELTNFKKENIRVRFIGDLMMLSKSLQSLIAYTERSTAHNSGLKLIVALSYSGRQDIVQACRLLATQAAEGLLNPADISESTINDKLLTNLAAGEMQNPDFLIRTSGEQRISNFLLWQMAYTELYFADALWPDFGEVEYKKALLSFQRRQRRYGSRH